MQLHTNLNLWRLYCHGIVAKKHYSMVVIKIITTSVSSAPKNPKTDEPGTRFRLSAGNLDLVGSLLSSSTSQRLWKYHLQTGELVATLGGAVTLNASCDRFSIQYSSKQRTNDARVRAADISDHVTHRSLKT